MTILAIDTSGPICGVALLRDGRILSEHTVLNTKTHSVNLIPMVDAVLQESQTDLSSVDRLACVTGPGSFTGVRIGVSTCKGLSHGSGIPCVAVDALETMAAGIPHSGAVICPIQDARAGQVYGAAFHASLTGRPVRLMPDTPLKLEDYLETVRPFGDRFLFLGDGMPVHRERIAELLGEKALFAPPQLSFIRPSAAARIAEDSEETLDYLSLQPMYLRSPSAERNRKLMEAQACRQST